MSRACKIVSFLLFFLLFSSCKGGDERPPEAIDVSKERGYRYPLRYEVDTLDPAYTQNNSSQRVISQIFDGLVRFDKDLNILPALAESWIISEDGKRYTFFIRKGVRFHNGREVKAEDFVYSIKRVLKIKAPVAKGDFFGKGLFRMEGLRAIDDYTLEIRLKEPYAPTLKHLALVDARVVPREYVEEEDFGKHPIGTGPFRFVRWEGNEVVLDANPDYFGGKSSLERLIFRGYPGPDDKGIFKDFLKGRLENSIIPWEEDVNKLKEKGFSVIKRPITKVHIYSFNTRLWPLSDKRVRQAIAYAIDRERVVKEAVRGRFVRAEGITPPGILGYNPSVRGYTYDPERAKELLTQAGFPEGKGLPILEFWTASQSVAARTELMIVKENLSNIGIRIKIRYAPWPDFEKRFVSRKAPIYRHAFHLEFPDPEAIYGVLIDSKGVYNYTFYKNPIVDSLLEKGRREMDVLKRVKVYREVEKIVLEDAPLIPILFYTFEQALQPRVRGFEASALGEIYIPMNKIWFEGSRTEK